MNNKEIRTGNTTTDSFEHMMITGALDLPEDLDTINKIITYRIPNVEYREYKGIKSKGIYKGPVILIDFIKSTDQYDKITKLRESPYFLEWRAYTGVYRVIFKYPPILLGKENNDV